LWLFYRSDFKIGVCRSWGSNMGIRMRRYYEQRLSSRVLPSLDKLYTLRRTPRLRCC